jgi:3-oxoacyl-[acyl-carrier-protein] synthase II
MTSAHPEGVGAARAMTNALAQSGMGPEDVSYISAHGTGTASNDRLETIAVKRAFRESAYRTPISSIKSMLGHTMGAASAIEAAVCAVAIRENRIPDNEFRGLDRNATSITFPTAPASATCESP